MAVPPALVPTDDGNLAAPVARTSVVLEGRWGVTVGKLALKLRVVDAQGRPPGYGKAAIRTLLRALSVF